MFVWNVLQKDQWWSQLSGSFVFWGLRWARQMHWGLGTKAPVRAKATGVAVWTHDRVDWLRTGGCSPSTGYSFQSHWKLVVASHSVSRFNAPPSFALSLGPAGDKLPVHPQKVLVLIRFVPEAQQYQNVGARSVCYLSSNLAALAMQE